MPPDSDPASASTRSVPSTWPSADRTAVRSAPRRTNPNRWNRPRLVRLTFSRIDRRRISPSSLRDSGIIATPALIDAAGCPPTGVPRTRTCPALSGIGPVDRPGELGPAGADQPGQADDLARPQGQGHVGDARGRQALDRDGDRGVGGRRLLRRIRPADGPAEHPGDEARLGLVGDRAGADDTAVAQDRDDVGQVEDLAEEVRDEDHGVAPRAQPAHDLVEALHLLRRQARGRLVEDDEVRVPGQRPEDLHLLLLGERQPADDRAGPDVEAGVRDQPVEPVAQRAALDEAGPLGLGTEEHVLGRGQPGDQGDLLGDEGDPLRQRLARGPERDGRPAQDQVALILREDPRDDLAERRLPGTVLADEGVDGAGPDGHRDLVEGSGRPEGLAEPANLEAGGVAGLGGHRVSRRVCPSARPLRERQEVVDVRLGDDAAVLAASRADPRPGPGSRSGSPG